MKNTNFSIASTLKKSKRVSTAVEPLPVEISVPDESSSVEFGVAAEASPVEISVPAEPLPVETSVPDESSLVAEITTATSAATLDRPKRGPVIEYVGPGAENVAFTPDPRATLIRVYWTGVVLTDY